MAHRRKRHFRPPYFPNESERVTASRRSHRRGERNCTVCLERGFIVMSVELRPTAVSDSRTIVSPIKNNRPQSKRKFSKHALWTQDGPQLSTICWWKVGTSSRPTLHSESQSKPLFKRCRSCVATTDNNKMAVDMGEIADFPVDESWSFLDESRLNRADCQWHRRSP